MPAPGLVVVHAGADIGNAPGLGGVEELFLGPPDGIARHALKRHSFHFPSQDHAAVGLDCSSQLRVFRRVSRVGKDYIKHRHFALPFPQFVEQLRMDPAIPQSRSLLECDIRPLIHFDNDDVVGNGH